MRVVNETPFSVAVVPNAEADDLMTVLFVVAASWIIEADGLRLAEQQRPIVMASGPQGVDDVQLLRRGVSVTASGFVYPDGATAPRAAARVVVGEWERRVTAIGPRVWHRGVADVLSATEPRPFERIAMSWDHAYGGSVDEPSEMMVIDGEPTIVPERAATYPYNFDGMGFYMKAAQADGQPLPLLEDPEHPIKRWDDRPEPVCFAPYPLWGGLRVGTVFDTESQKVDVSRANRLTGRACPRLTFETVPAGTPIRLEGMRPGGADLGFEVQPAPATIHARVGVTEATLSPVLDCIDIDAESRLVRFVYRHLLQYALIQHDERVARVMASDAFRSRV